MARASRVAEKLLRGPLPERWLHTRGVVERAAKLAVTVPVQDRPLLVAAAWLHDIGYAPVIKETGFRPSDGALCLSDPGSDERLVAPVAHRSGARFVPVERGFASLMAEFHFEALGVSDALTYAGSDGRPGRCPGSRCGIASRRRSLDMVRTHRARRLG